MIIPVDYLQANIRLGGVALPLGAEVTQGFAVGSFPSPTPTGVANDIADAWSTNVMPTLVNSVTFIECAVKFGPNDTGPAGAVARAVAGSNADQPLCPNTALLVRKITTLGGRRGRGRMYVPGVPETRFDGAGNMNSGDLNAYQVAFDGFLADCLTAGLEAVVLHAAGISSTPAPTPMIEYSVQSKAATQRDRMRR